DRVPDAGALEPIVVLGAEIPKALLVAAALAVALALALARPRPGLELRLTGASPGVARAQGFSPVRAAWTAFLLGGALSGLAGALVLAAVTRRLTSSFGEGAGYTAVAVALVADLRPLAVFFAAIAFAALETGAQAAQRQAGVPRALAFALEGAIILAVLAQRALRARRRAAPAEAVSA